MAAGGAKEKRTPRRLEMKKNLQQHVTKFPFETNRVNIFQKNKAEEKQKSDEFRKLDLNWVHVGERNNFYTKGFQLCTVHVSLIYVTA